MLLLDRSMWPLVFCFTVSLIFGVPSSVVQGHELGDEQPNSTTPYKEGTNPIIDMPKLGHFVILPKNVDGPTPYNCFAHAKRINNRWVIALKGVVTFTMDQIMAANNCVFVACADRPEDTRCPQERPTLVWLIYNHPSDFVGPMPEDFRPIHGMRKENGTWTSKNGQGPLYNNIANPHAFLDRWYPVDPSQRREIRCVCCPETADDP
jgi:hypothetical protein